MQSDKRNELFDCFWKVMRGDQHYIVWWIVPLGNVLWCCCFAKKQNFILKILESLLKESLLTRKDLQPWRLLCLRPFLVNENVPQILIPLESITLTWTIAIMANIPKMICSTPVYSWSIKSALREKRKNIFRMSEYYY